MMAGRRLLFFFDGSSNTVGSVSDTLPTNVFRLIRAFTYGFSGVPQIAFYFSGVGTRGDKLSVATGRGFDQIVIEAYVNLASNYMDGDSIYMFGFSRGAAAARALAGLISDPGLLPADNLESFSEVWKYFLKGSVRGEGWREVLRSRFRDKLFGPDMRVKFLGAFDTVAGSSWDWLSLFTEVRFNSLVLDRSVDVAVQILSIDDDRNPSFTPLLWDGKARPEQIVEQIWMPGVHADVGGCSDGRFIGNVALLTMIDRVCWHCKELEIDRYYIKALRDNLRHSESITITNERTDFARKVLLRNKRRIGYYADEYVHNLVNFLHQKTIRVRGKSQIYEPQNLYDPENFPEKMKFISTKQDKFIRSVTEKILITQKL